MSRTARFENPSCARRIERRPSRRSLTQIEPQCCFQQLPARRHTARPVHTPAIAFTHLHCSAVCIHPKAQTASRDHILKG